ncbi:hypothetical protein ACFL6S_18490 [Candidatus Poribacteria bacterium]
MRQYKGWKYSARIRTTDDDVECYLSFHKEVEGRDWYDEVRYDSHERKRGQRLELPHYHIKLRGDYKTPGEAEADLIRIINDIVPQVLEVTEK